MGYFTYSKCKVVSLLWFAHFNMRICGDAQLLDCSLVVDHTSVLLILQVNLIGQRSFFQWGGGGGVDKTCHFLVPHFNCCNLKILMVIPIKILIKIVDLPWF